MTGEYDDCRYYTEPIYFKGTKDELTQMFHHMHKGMLLKDRFVQSMLKLGIIHSNMRMKFEYNRDIKIGSRCLDVYDFLEKGTLYPPDVKTLDEWFDEAEHNDK